MTVVSLRPNLSYSTCQVDLTVFESYYQQYLPKVFNYVSYRMHDQSTAEDLTAIIFERALGKFHTYSPERAAFSTWLFTIAHNVVANYLRGQRRQPDITPLEALPNVIVNNPSPEEIIIEAEQFYQIQLHLSSLNEQEQEVIALKFASELKNQEIAQIMNLTPSHVGVLLHRSLGKLRQIFEEVG